MATITKPAPQIASFECSGCGAVHNAGALGGEKGLPVGWAALGSDAWCPSCTQHGVSARAVRRPRRRAA